MKVLICGGGCAGPALAFWLARLGHDVTVLERFSSLRSSGAQIDLRDKGITVVKHMGLLHAIRERRVDEAGAAIIDHNGKAWATSMANKSGKGPQGPTSEYEIMRGDMVRLLYGATKDNVKYVFGKSVTSYEQNEEQATVKARFSDGSSDTYDLLVGADGQGSRIRKAMIPGDADPYFHSGLHMAYWFIPRIATDSNIRDNYHSEGGRMILRRSHSPKETQAYFILRDADPSIRAIHRAPEEKQKEFWKEKFRDAGWQAERFIQGMETTNNFYCSEIVQVKLDTWHKGRVVLLGDAAFCPSPLSGMGTTNAFVGAYVLAGELSRVADGGVSVEEALTSYETTLRPFIDQTQDVNFDQMKYIIPQTALGIRLMRWTMWFVYLLKVPQLMQKLAPAEKGKWALPEYPRMMKEFPKAQ